jgi:hypothetical protein
VLGALLAVGPAVARAQSDDEVAARRLALSEAERARAAGRHEEALEFARRAGGLQMTPSVRMFITQELAALGRNAQAFQSAELCLREVQTARELHNAEAIRAACAEIEQQTRGRVGQVVIDYEGAAPEGLEVRVGEAVLRSNLLGLPRVVEPGVQAIAASAPGYEPFRADVTVAPAGREHVRIALRRAAVAPRAEAPPRGPAASPAPWVVAGLGGAVAIAGVGTFLGYTLGPLARCTRVAPAVGSTPEDWLCPDEATEVAARDRAFMEPLGVGLLVGGAAVVAGGVVWGLVSRGAARASEREAAAHLAPIVGPGAVGVRGAF